MSLHLAEFLVGILLIFCGSSLVFRTDFCEHILRKFLRSEAANSVTFSVAGIWFLGHVLTLCESDFGEYKYVLFIFFLTIILIALSKLRDFLSVRGAAMLCLLISNELLKVAFLQPYVSRLILVLFVYLSIIAAMVFGGWPYMARDCVNFIFCYPTRPRLLGFCFTAYGALMLTTLFW